MARSRLSPIFNPYKTLLDNLKGSPEKETFLGFSVDSLYGMAACPGTATSGYVDAAFQNGFDIITYKTQRSVRFPSNSFPNVLQLDFSGHLTTDRAAQPIVGYLPESLDPMDITIANSCGNNCEGAEFWMADFNKAVQKVGANQLLIMSVVGTIQEGFTEEQYNEDFALTAGLAVQAGAKVIELNLSCPNVANEGIICYTPHIVKDICRRVREEIGPEIKLLAKITYFKPNQEELLRDIVLAMADFVDGISVTNTMAATIVDKNGKPAFPGPGREKAGVSGSAIKWAGIEMVSRLKNLREVLDLQYVILGMGGVLKPQDYLDYRTAGADAVQSATGAMWNPDLAHQIKSFLQAPYLTHNKRFVKN